LTGTTQPAYTIAVRALCEFTAKAGDLDLRFTPSPSAQEGIAGHAVVAARRGDGYRAELPLSGEWNGLRVRGRADGYDENENLIEEIKTHRGRPESIPDNHRHLHWAQVRVYGHLLCQERGLDAVNLALVYYDIGSGVETVLREQRDSAWLQTHFAGLCERFSSWAAQESAHRAARNDALTHLRFPHADFRPGQRHLSESIYRANTSGRCLLAQAPTGIGKTVGSLFPTLKAMPQQGIDKVFFLAAKTPGRRLALDGAAKLCSAKGTETATPLRVLELTARDKACEHPDKACHGDACPLARGFYDRLPAARAAAAEVLVLDREALRTVALEHDVCPYYLGSEMTRWVDMIVGDYNYYFDGGAMLYALAQANGWKASVLVDEAHNLVNRARSMYSAEIDRELLRAARAVAPPAVKKALERVGRAWTNVDKGAPAPYQLLESMPAKLVDALQDASSTINEHLAAFPGPLDPDLQRFHFDALQFARLAESFGPHSLVDLSRDADRPTLRDSTICIRNVVPAPFLGPRFAASHSSTLFSGTLGTWQYCTDTLGLPADTAWVEVDSPFTASQLDVHVAKGISTRYQARAASVQPIAELIARQFHERPGNYLAFFSSFDYMDQVAGALAKLDPGVTAWRQERRMSETARQGFIDRFAIGGAGVGFAVLGGAFGEGVDLPGERLIGAFVATLGLPQVNPVNEQLRERMQTLFGAGYDYTYLYPGIQKVVQAAGRVIRTEQDRGVVWLIDDRFAQPGIRALMPAWWELGAHNSR
jgi:DNA excision repair protein ERCC-2